MKVRFHENDGTQKPVKPEQNTMRAAQGNKKPISKIIGIMAAIALVIILSIWITRARSVHTYGIISSPLQEMRAPFYGEVQQITVQRGDYIKKGDLLLTIVMLPPTNERTAQQQLQKQLVVKKKSVQQDAQLELAKIKAKYDEAEAIRLSAIAKARIEVSKLKAFQDNKKADYEKTQEMFKMDATVAANVDAAQRAMQLAEHNLQQAKADHQLAIKKSNPYKQDLQRVHGNVGALSKGETTADIAVEQAKLDVLIARNEPQVQEFRAAFDGIVMEANAVKGGNVSPQELLVSIADPANIWLDAYVPVQKRSFVEIGREVTIFVPGDGESVTGQISGSKAAVVRTPEILQEKMPHTNTTIYNRVAITDPKGLLPGNIVKVMIHK